MAITIYTTRYCGYCHRAKQLLNGKGVAFHEIAVDGNAELRREMVERSHRTTVPQIWIGDTHIGGCDELYDLDRSGRLDPMLAADRSAPGGA